MSKSLKRVEAALAAAGLDCPVMAMDAETRTAAQAAAAAGCGIDQIVKSIAFRTLPDGPVVLFLTAGGNRVSHDRASAAAGCALGPADADLIRRETGFAIGGVAPVGHLTPPAVFLDPRLLDFDRVWAAAGTPRHIFPVAPQDLLRITGARVVEFTE